MRRLNTVAHEAELTRTPEPDTADGEPLKTDPLGTGPMKTDPLETGPLKTGPLKTEAQKAEPQEAEPQRPGKAAKAVVSDGREVHDAIEAVLAAPGESREVAFRAYEAVRDRLVADALDVMPVDRLRDLIPRKVTFAPLIDAGIETVGQILATGAEGLRQIPGVRRRAARRITAAAVQMRESVEAG